MQTLEITTGAEQRKKEKEKEWSAEQTLKPHLDEEVTTKANFERCNE